MQMKTTIELLGRRKIHHDLKFKQQVINYKSLNAQLFCYVVPIFLDQTFFIETVREATQIPSLWKRQFQPRASL